MHKNNQNIILQQDDSETFMDISLRKAFVNILYGNIFNLKGEPISNVSIKLVDQKLNPIMHTVSSKDGSYTLLSNHDYSNQLLIAKLGYATLLIKKIIINHHMHLTLNEIQLNTCDVVGKCLYNDGTHAKDVVIILDKDTTNKRIISDCYGSFIFFQIACGLHKLEISGQTCEPFKTYFEIYDSDKLINLNGICLKKKNIGCTIHGIIKGQNGVVLPNVLVLLYCSFCRKFVMRTYSNTAGIYFFGNLEKGSYYIKAIY